MFVGAHGHLGETFALETDTMYLREVVLPTAGRLYLANLWLSGKGGGAGPATITPVIYSRPGNARLATGTSLSIAAGTTGGYVALTFPTPPLLAAGTYAVGVLVGGPAHTLEAAYDELAVPRVHNAVRTVATAGAPVAVSTGPKPVEWAVVVAAETNAGLVALGSSTADLAAQNARHLIPGQQMNFGEVDLADLYVDALVNGDRVAYVYSEMTSAGLSVAATYASGPPSSISPSVNPYGLALYATPTVEWAPVLSALTEEYIAELPWPESQTIFSAQGTVANSGRLGKLSWYGTNFHPAIGAYAIVQTGSTYEGLLGERLKVTYNGRSVWVYVTDVADTDDVMALSRLAFIHLAAPALDAIDALVEVVSA